VRAGDIFPRNLFSRNFFRIRQKKSVYINFFIALRCLYTTRYRDQSVPVTTATRHGTLQHIATEFISLKGIPVTVCVQSSVDDPEKNKGLCLAEGGKPHSGVALLQKRLQIQAGRALLLKRPTNTGR